MELWMHGISSESPQDCLSRLRELEFSAVVLGANKPNIEASKQAGLDTYVCTGTFSRSEDFKDERYLAHDVEGKPREWFGSTCPNVAGVREENISKIEKVLGETKADGLMLDGCRFASPASGLGALFTCFCPRCRRKSEDMGFHFSRMRDDARKLYRTLADGRLGEAPRLNPFSLLSEISHLPGIADWMAFRRMCVIEHFQNVADIVHEMGAEMGGYIFTPCLSPIVGQDYADLGSILDIASPMIYRNYPQDPGPACLNKETAALVTYLQRGGLPDEEASDFINRFLGLEEHGKLTREIADSTTLKSVEKELERSSQLLEGVRKRIPILYLGDEQVEKSIKTASNLDLEGVDFFVYKDEWDSTVERIGTNYSQK